MMNNSDENDKEKKKPDPSKIAEILAKAMEDAGLGKPEVVMGTPDNLGKILRDFAKDIHRTGDGPCESGMHEALAISCFNGYPPTREMKTPKTIAEAREWAHGRSDLQFAGSFTTMHFWKFLGKGLGWKEDDGVTMPEYMIHWHEFINHLNKEDAVPVGGYADEFFDRLIQPWREKLKREAEEKGS